MSLEGRVIGLVEDDPIMGESLVQSLTLEGSHVDWWRTGRDAMRGLLATSPDLVVCDIRLPDLTGDRLFRELAGRCALPPFLFVTAFGDIGEAVELMQRGAGDYMTKPFAIADLVGRANALIHRHPMSHADAVLGVSDAMREIETVCRRISTLSSPVLITGETGSGKEICARFLHRNSARSREPFVAVNCAAIPAELMESELLGHEKGAFSGAHALHRGYAERARSGILFLDEIGEMPLGLQAKLLRLVEAREFHRVGGETSVPFGARVVCATNSDLVSEARHGRFREDLLYRIDVVRIDLPPMRRRPADLPWLMDLFFEQLKGDGQINIRGFSTLAYDAALEHAWPGNVRELRNRIERALALARGDWVMPADLFPEVAERVASEGNERATLAEVRDAAERRQIERVLKETGRQVGETARLLGISRTTLWEKMRRLDLGAVEPDD